MHGISTSINIKNNNSRINTVINIINTIVNLKLDIRSIPQQHHDSPRPSPHK